MKDSLSDVHRLLMQHLETLTDEELSGERLEATISRAKAACSVSSAITANARVVLDAHVAHGETMGSRAPGPPKFIAG